MGCLKLTYRPEPELSIVYSKKELPPQKSSKNLRRDELYLYNGMELQEELETYDFGARQYDPALARWYVIDPMYERHYDWSPYVYVLNNPIANIDLYGCTDWPTVLKGAATFTAGLGSTVGGVAAAATPTGVGQIGGAVLISTGVPSMGLGIGIMVDGFRTDGANNIPGGVNEAVGMAGDALLGNENGELQKAGSVVDIATNFAAGAPSTAAEVAAIGVLTIDAANEIAGSDNTNTSTSASGTSTSSTESTTTAASDNTSVATTPVPEIDLNSVQIDDKTLEEFFGD